MGKAAPALLDVWIYFNLIANTILLPILVATFLISRRARRSSTLVNVCMTWIFSGIFSLLLYYAGKHRPNTPEPPKPLCIAQTSLLYGITPMWSVAILVLLHHLIASINDRVMGKGKMILMLSSPYVVQCAFSIATLAIAIQHPDKVNRHRRFFYCALKFIPLSNAMAIFTFIVCLGIVALEIQLGLILYRYWRGMRKAGQTSNVDPQLLIRVLVFGIYIFFGMVVNVVSIFDEHSLAPDMYAATIGTVVLLVFGTQADVLRAWCFWRKDPPSKAMTSASLDLTSPYKNDLEHSPLPELPETPQKVYFDDRPPPIPPK